MDKEQLKQILEAHRKWRWAEDGGQRANLRGANLWGADLCGADLCGADLCGADLCGADLCDANLCDANLRGADLRGANLWGANLHGADLRDANLRGLRGNMHHVKTIQADLWPVSYTATHMQIGCQRHEISEWWGFTDEQIRAMEARALDWWRVWKPILQTIIAASPAEPTKAEKEEAA